jgi:hypothetical protein
VVDAPSTTLFEGRWRIDTKTQPEAEAAKAA